MFLITMIEREGRRSESLMSYDYWMFFLISIRSDILYRGSDVKFWVG